MQAEIVKQNFTDVLWIKNRKKKTKQQKVMGKNNKEAQLGKNKKNKRTRRDTKMCYKHFVKRLKEAPLKDKEKKSK